MSIIKWLSRKSEKPVKIFLSVLFPTAAAVLCGQIIYYSLENQNYKNDYAELNNIKYGFLSIEAWDRQITMILIKEVSDFNLSKTTRMELRNFIENIIGKLIDETYRKIREGNMSTREGRIKQALMDIFININKIKTGIPAYADSVMKEISESKDIRRVLIKKVKQYSSATFDAEDRTLVDHILRKTNSKDIESAVVFLNKTIFDNHDRIIRKAEILICLAIGIFLLFGIRRQPLDPLHYVLLIFTLVLLLLTGITTPMIDLDARVSHLVLIVMGYTIHFENQVLYFQSKSILDVFWILITNRDLLMKFVGVLLITFSIFFPFLKTLSTTLYYYNYHDARENKIIRFFVLKSGKWSMADVIVVAIFMTYIGFNGVIANLFSKLRETVPQVQIISTNGTSLQPGYYLFLTYCLLAMFLSEFLKKSYRQRNIALL